jgi:hypothetical protein
MIERLLAPVSVWAVFDHRARQLKLTRLVYDGRDYAITRTPYHFTRRAGRTLIHVFCAASNSAYFKVCFNTDTLLWSVEEIHDHEPNPSAFQH